MTILGIETSCDETAAAIIQIEKNKPFVKLISRSIASSIPSHSQTGGVIPEIAARNQIQSIIPVINQTLKEGSLTIDTIAVTIGPGLVGSLLVGIETAKALAFVWNKPIIPVNHLFGHIYANWIENDISFPAIGLIVSGGHTDLVLMKNHKKNIMWLGGTRDDAAGEAFDKIGRMLNLPYPAGATIERLAKNGNPNSYHFPRPLMYDKACDFSFSGLKTAVLREVDKHKKLDKQTIADISRGALDAIIEVLVYKTIQAAKMYQAASIVLGGGVASNQVLRDTLQLSTTTQTPQTKIFAPEKSLCVDNAAMIATAAFYHYHPISWQKLTVEPELYFD